MINKIKEKGFNLVELMVSVSIMCFLFVLSAPTYTAWMANMRVRNTSESILFGVQQARAEAIRRNDEISFVLNSDTSWQILDSNNNIINKKQASESSDGVNITVVPNESPAAITFNGVGATIQNLSGNDRISQIDVNSTKNFDGIKSLRVLVGNGGSGFICDPSVAQVDDARYCRGT